MRKSLATLFLCLLPAWLLAAGCSKAAPAPAQPLAEAKKVRVARVEHLGVEEAVSATGSMAAQDRAVLSSKVPGRLEKIQVDLGSVVKKGDLLAEIEKRDFELRRRQAEASLAQARARLGLHSDAEEEQLEPERTSLVKEAQAVLAEATKNRDRIVSLVKQGVLPDADAESAESQFEVAASRFQEAVHEARNRMATLKLRQAELDLAEQELRDTEIRAPFDGVVEQRQASPGEFLNVGAPILTLVRVDPIRVRLEVAEKDAPRVRAGQKVYLRVEGSNELYEGVISRLSPVITRDNRMLLAEADFPNPEGELRPGAFGRAEIVVNANAPGLFVPRGAIITFAGIRKIFLAEAGQAVEKEVRLGREKGDLVEVRGEIKAGGMVVLEPGTLRDGQRIESEPNDT